MIIHEVGKYYNKESYNEIIKDLHDDFNFKDISDLKHQMALDPNLKDRVKTNIISLMSNNIIISVDTKDRNTPLKLAQDLGLDKEIFTKDKPVHSKKEMKVIMKRNDPEELEKAYTTALGSYLYDNSKQNFFNARILANRYARNINGKDVRKETIMKQWEQRKQKWKEKHDKEKRRKMLVGGGIGLAGAGTAYLAARKLAKLKGLENKYARKLLLLPPNKRSFVQKMLDKIRALIRKYKH